MRKSQLMALVAIPLLYYFALLVGAASYPGYSHVTRYASELGAAGAPYPGLFNYSVMAMGLAAMFGAVGLAGALRELSGRWLWAIWAALALAVWGFAMVMGGAFPIPDERHGAYGLGLAGPLVPAFTLLAIRAVRNSAAMRAFLAFIIVGSIVLLLIMMGIGSLVTHDNVGIWQRINSAFGMPWLAVVGCWLIARRRPPGALVWT
ncbi:MAG: DUF998 domain-containing protein [Allosphingosinicella sp.]